MSSTSQIKEFFAAFDSQRESLIEDYFRFLRFQSVSAEAAYAADVRACAEWLSAYLRDGGFHVDLWETGRHPVVFGSWVEGGVMKPTALFYGHYDVQPVDPVSEWNSPPFEPEIRGEEVYCRGALDNKGQLIYVAAALKTLLKEHGRLPLNVKLCFEGEEEMGSPGLSKILPDHATELQADHLLVVDVNLAGRMKPTVTVGCRGLVTMTAEVTGSSVDLHSGSHGGIAYNPNRALVELLAKLHDAEGTVTIPGFYDSVVMPSDEERARLDFSFSEEAYRKTFGALPAGGEKRFLPLESNWLRPSLEINGLRGGYLGDGFKTVIPAKATAKISCRLVPNQDPVAVGRLVKGFLESHAPEGVAVKVTVHEGFGKPVRSKLSSRVVQASAQAYEEVLGSPASYILDGATIPIISEIAAAAGAEPVLIGYGLNDDHIHAPNEHFGLDRMRLGFATISRIVHLLGKE